MLLRSKDFKRNEQTNNEWRKTCSAEEFAAFLSRYIGICAVCKHSDECDYDEDETYNCPYGDDNCKAWESWLKERHTE